MRKLVVLLLCCLMLGGCGSSKDSESKMTVAETTAETDIKKQKPEETEKRITTKDDIFNDYKRKTINTMDDIPVNDEELNRALKYFNDSYYEVRNFKELPDTGEGAEYLVKFNYAISYLTRNFDEGSAGRAIGDAGWDAVRSLMLGTGDFADKMDKVKLLYEISGNYVYKTKYSEGQYKVGTDIQAGEYVVFADNGMGYFRVSSDSNGKDIIANENFDYNSIITIKDGEYFKLSRSEAVPIEEVSSLPLDQANMFKIGLHLPAGEYKLIADKDSAYYCIYNDDRQDDIEANDNFSGQSYVKVSDGQYLVLSRCHIEQ